MSKITFFPSEIKGWVKLFTLCNRCTIYFVCQQRR